MYSEPKRFDNFLLGIIEGVLARRDMRQDILKLRSSSQQLEDKITAMSPEELLGAETWSSGQSTVTMGTMTPAEDWNDTSLNMATGQDKALEDILETIDTKQWEADVAKLVLHWTNFREFGRISRHGLKKEDCP